MNLLVRSQPSSRPVKVMQFGEGNFLRAFIDWMIQRLNSATDFNGQVRIIQPLPHGNAAAINAQGGIYTLVLRGVSQGQTVEQREIIDVVNDCLNPYQQWAETVALSCNPDLRFVFSNTTEAGIEFKPEAYQPEHCPQTFPAKLTSLLHARFQAFAGADDRGLIIIPCELIEKNGSALRECVHQYATLWRLPAAFTSWIDQSCIFVNTLVDRIVSGYPHHEAERWQTELGYQDNLLVCGEIFHFLVLEADQELARELPFKAAGLNVLFTDDLTPYRTRKVRFLNGAHTACVLAASLAGLTYVDEMMADETFGKLVRQAVLQDIFPTVPLPDEEKLFFARSVLERFQNPYAQHRLLAIALNSVSKWTVRVLPTLLDYVHDHKKLPPTLAFSLSALLRFYQIKLLDNGQAQGQAESGTYEVNDEPAVLKKFAEATEILQNDRDLKKYARQLLAEKDFWGRDLNEIPKLTERVVEDLQAIEKQGVRKTVEQMLAAGNP